MSRLRGKTLMIRGDPCVLLTRAVERNLWEKETGGVDTIDVDRVTGNRRGGVLIDAVCRVWIVQTAGVI